MADSHFVKSQDYEAVLKLVEDPKSSVVIIYGVHGIGKTCLARQLLVDLVELHPDWETYTIHTRTREMYQMSSQAIIRSKRQRDSTLPEKYKPEFFELAKKLWSERGTLLFLLDELQLEGEKVGTYWPKLTQVEHIAQETKRTTDEAQETNRTTDEAQETNRTTDEAFDEEWVNDVIQQLKVCTEQEKPGIKLLLTLKQIPTEMKKTLKGPDVKYYGMKGFSPDNTRDFLHSYTNSDIVLNRYADINEACQHVPLLHKAVGYTFSAMNDPDEVEEYLEHINQQREEVMDVYEPSMIVLRNIPQLTIWKIVRQLGRTLIPKDFIIAIIIEYKYSKESMKPKDRLVDELRSTDIFAMMRNDFMKNELMAENREGTSRAQIYFTIHQVTWTHLDTLIRADAEELQLLYKRLALRAIAAVIEFDDRFHAYTKETPSKLSYTQNHTMILREKLSENQSKLNGFETFLYYRLLLGVYYPKRKLGTANQQDIDDLGSRIEEFADALKNVRKGNDIDKGRLKFDEESKQLCEMSLKRQRFTDRDKDFISEHLKDVRVKVDPRRHLQNEDYKSKTDLIVELRKAKLLLGQEVYHKVIFEETRAVMYILLSKMKVHNRSVGSQMDELKDEDLEKAREIFKDLEEKNKILFLQHIILERDRLILELPNETPNAEYPDDDQGLTKVIEKCDELIGKYRKLYKEDSKKENSGLAYEFGFARSQPSKDNYHTLICLEKILDINGRKVLALRRCGGRDTEEQCYKDASDVLTDIKNRIKAEEESNQPRAYAYALRHVAGFLSSGGEVGLALRYYSFALTRLQQYSAVNVKLSVYEKICQSIVKLSRASEPFFERSSERRPGVEIFDDCFCISRLGELTDPPTECECKFDYMVEKYIKPMLDNYIQPMLDGSDADASKVQPNKVIRDALLILQKFRIQPSVSE